MIDAIALLTLAGGAAGGYVAGWLAHVRSARRRAALNATPQPICLCKHGWNRHDEDGKCHGTTEQRIFKYGSFNRNEWVECTCQRYTGPIPLDAWTPFVLPARRLPEEKAE